MLPSFFTATIFSWLYFLSKKIEILMEKLICL